MKLFSNPNLFKATNKGNWAQKLHKANQSQTPPTAPASIEYNILTKIEQIASQVDQMAVRESATRNGTSSRQQFLEQVDKEWVRSEMLMAMGLEYNETRAAHQNSSHITNEAVLDILFDMYDDAILDAVPDKPIKKIGLIDTTFQSAHGNQHTDVDLFHLQEWYKLAGITAHNIVKHKVIEDVWQTVASIKNIFLYTAFYDDRPDIVIPSVRVISVAEVGAANQLYCLIFKDAYSPPQVERAETISIGAKIYVDFYGLYEQIMLSCNVTTSDHGWSPSFVSIVSLSDRQPINVLEVEKFEQPTNSSAVEFGICMSIIYWSHNPKRIIEWLELHRLWGVSEVSVYASMLSKKIARIFLHYSKTGFVRYREVPIIFDSTKESAILVNMSPVINDCMYRNMLRYRTILTTDVDEMIVPRRHDNYMEMRHHVLQMMGTNDLTPSLLFRNVYFFVDFDSRVNDHSSVFNITQRMTPSTIGYSAKAFTNPLTCIGLQNHFCWKRVPRYDVQGWKINVPAYIAMNHHYKKCHFDAYLHRSGVCSLMLANRLNDTAMNMYKDVIQQRINIIQMQLLHNT
jgi:hypothetical protein